MSSLLAACPGSAVGNCDAAYGFNSAGCVPDVRSSTPGGSGPAFGGGVSVWPTYHFCRCGHQRYQHNSQVAECYGALDDGVTLCDCGGFVEDKKECA